MCLLMFSYVIMEWKSSFPIRYGELYWRTILHLMFVRCLLSLFFFFMVPTLMVLMVCISGAGGQGPIY